MCRASRCGGRTAGSGKSIVAKKNKIDILLEDEHVLVINKPAGLLTIPGRQGGVALREAVAHQLRRPLDLRLVYRLDRQTSGVLLLAKTLDAQRELSRQFRRRTVDKYYLAIVAGFPEEDGGLIDAPLAPHPHQVPRMVVNLRKGRPSRTEWEVVERWRGAALIRCKLLTGRQHQIRVHLQHIGLPLLVDELYGEAGGFYLSQIKFGYRTSRRGEERPLIGRLTLHAESIAFDHPQTGERLTISAPLPKDFGAALNQLRRWAR